ncbi:MAG TPA: hypothetical protein ENK11_10530, partial [Phycisphaerales bacterium]|nr:hypothetical protein [Phycisphaerales bacterium]
MQSGRHGRSAAALPDHPAGAADVLDVPPQPGERGHLRGGGCVIEAARRYIEAGLRALPADRETKRPIRAVGRWKPYIKRPPTEAELSAWFANGPDALCILCGEASGNLEAMDFDAGGELFNAWWAKIPADLRAGLVVERTRSGGWHVIYRCCATVCGNLKLAQRKTGEGVVTLIETRGEGGLIICAPTPGYEVTQGDLCDPPVLSEDERDALLRAAWELNEYLPPAVNGPPDRPHDARVGPMSRPSAGGVTDRPGDDFNARGDVRAVLETHGWVRTKGGDNEYWRRPGKTSGMSATLKDRVFYVFSSNAHPFEANRAYSPFAVYALLDHGGDFEQAASALRQLGFGGDPHASLADHANGANISAIVRMSAAPGACPSDNGVLGQTIEHRIGQAAPVPDIADPGPMPAEMLRVPGLISEVMDHTLAIAPYPNHVMAFGGALALQAFLAGRKVRDPGDNRTNLYLLGL